ncbi:unnamed protein product, partial [Durusdinium trenchii]
MAAPEDAFPPLPRTKLQQRKPETPILLKAAPTRPNEPVEAAEVDGPSQEASFAPGESSTAAPAAVVGTATALPELDGMVMLALKSPKERSFLLKLESHIINNLQSGTIERIKLTTPMPPKHRKLVHMVSDYFGLHRIVDKEEGEEKKATMTLLKMPQTRIPARSLSVICTELDDEDRPPAPVQPVLQVQRKVAEGAVEEGASEAQAPPQVEEPSRSKPSWAEVAAKL